MNPPWDRWIPPKPVLISKLILEDFEKSKDDWNFFKHYHEGFQPNTFPKGNPPSFQVDTEYVNINSLDPKKGNMLNLMWEGMKVKEKRFWQAALEHHRENSLKGDSSVYHWASFLHEPEGRKYTLEAPKCFDEDFYYNDTTVDALKLQSRTATTESKTY